MNTWRHGTFSKTVITFLNLIRVQGRRIPASQSPDEAVLGRRRGLGTKMIPWRADGGVLSAKTVSKQLDVNSSVP